MLINEQKKVVYQAIAALTFCFAFAIISYYVFPFKLSSMSTMIERLIFTIRCELFPLIMLLLAICTVGNIRFFTDAIDGSRNNKNVEIHLRYLQNTLEQFVLLLVGHLVLCTYLTEHQMKIIPILVTLFIIGRTAFWYGYLKSPTGRAFGFGTTAYPTVIVLGYDLYCLINSIIK